MKKLLLLTLFAISNIAIFASQGGASEEPISNIAESVEGKKNINDPESTTCDRSNTTTTPKKSWWKFWSKE